MSNDEPTAPDIQGAAVQIRPKTRPVAALLSVLLLCVGASACGDKQAGGPSSRASSTGIPAGKSNLLASNAHRWRHVHGYLERDEDTDQDDEGPSLRTREDNLIPLSFGEAASQADRRTIAALVNRYYTAAAADNGAQACKLLYPTLAAGMSESPGLLAQRGAVGCAAAMSRLFTQQHEQLVADDVATMVVADVRVKGGLALATVGFRARPVGWIRLERVRGAWKVDALLDTDPT